MGAARDTAGGAGDSGPTAFASLWRPRLAALATRVREVTRAALAEAAREGRSDGLARPVAQGAGDVTYGIDVPAERELERWARETARETPLSLMTEDAGWLHLGPADGTSVELDGFDHGGPRIAIDPIDGTRNLMTDLRSAWTVIALAGPGAAAPRMSDVTLGILSEIPDTRGGQARVLTGEKDGACHMELRRIGDARGDARDSDQLVHAARLHTGHDARVDHGYFPFFKYMADMRPLIASVEAAFFKRLAEREGADVRNCYDDQYISNGGQLALLSTGVYRMIADLRALLAERRGKPTMTTKPYDVAGAIVCARAAGAIIEAPDGGELDFPIDTSTPLSFVGWTNAETRARLGPHLWQVLERLG